MANFSVMRVVGGVSRATVQVVANVETWPTERPAALELAIEKWQFIVTYLEQNPEHTVHCGNGRTCALCHQINFARGCTGCIVAQTMGEAGCVGTPWEDFAGMTDDADSQIEAAREELEFLKGLRRDNG